MGFIKHKNAFAVLIGITCLFFYALFWSGIHYSIDGVVMFQYAKALLFQRSLAMDPPVVWGQNEIAVSKWAIGQTLAYIPFLWAFSKTIFAHDPSYTQIPYDPELRRNPDLLDNQAYLSVSYVNALITTATVVFFFLLLVDLGLTKRKASVVALLFGLASPAAVYAKLDYAQPLAALCLVLAFYFLNRAHRQDSARHYLFSGVALGGLILARTEMLVFQIPLMVITVLLLQVRRPKGLEISKNGIWRLAVFCLPILVVASFNQYFNYLRFGGWFSTGYDVGHMFRPALLPLMGNLVSPGRGLLLFFPLAWLGFLSIPRLNKQIMLGAMFCSAFGGVLFYSVFNDGWAAGVSWGPRLLIPYLPLFAALSYYGYETLRAKSHLLANGLFAILALAGGVVALQGQLFNWLRFYGSFRLSNQAVQDGLHHFSAAYSPIFSGWNQLLQPGKYDIYWFQNPTGLRHLGMVAAMGIAFVLGTLLLTWILVLLEPKLGAGRAMPGELKVQSEET